MNWINKVGADVKDPEISDDIREIEFDEMWRITGRTISWITGGRNTANFLKLYEKFNHLKNCIFYTDGCDAFETVIPTKQHKIEKIYTTAIEQDNSNTRHYLGRMTRRTNVVPKSEEMVNISMKFPYALQCEQVFDNFQKIFSSIYN